MATERQQATLRQLIKDVERYALEVYGEQSPFGTNHFSVSETRAVVEMSWDDYSWRTDG